MTTTRIAMVVLSVAWLALGAWLVLRDKPNAAAPLAARIVGLSMLAAITAALAWLATEFVGGTRTRPTRVSDPSQQGDVVPDSLVSRGRAFYVAKDETEQGKHRSFRYEASDPPKTTPVGVPFPAAVRCQHLTKTPSSVLLVGCADGTLWVCTDPLATTPSDFKAVKASSTSLDVVDDIESGKSGIYVLGRTGGNAVACEISADFANYSQLAGVQVAADAARSLLVAKQTPAVAFVYEKSTITGIAAWRLESTWKMYLSKADDGAVIDEATMSQDTVFFTFQPKSGKASLWVSEKPTGTDLTVDDAAHLSGDEDQLFLAGSSGGNPTVFTVLTAKPTSATALTFDAMKKPGKIHDVVVEDSTAYVLADRGTTTELWMHSGTTLTVNSVWAEFDETPRGLDVSGYCCLVGESSLFVDGSDQPLLAKDALAGYAAPRLVTQGAHILFVARHKVGGELAVFSSYLK